MEIDSFKFGRREKVIIFVQGEFAEQLEETLKGKYNSKLSHDVLISDIENKRIDILIITNKIRFIEVTRKYGLYLERFFKIELSSLNNSLYSVLDQYFSLEFQQTSLIHLLRQFNSLEKVIEHFPEESIVIRNEYDDNDVSIKSISYVEEKLIYHGLTRDYRGETVLYNHASETYYLLRGNLPVFEEYVTLVNVDDHGRILVTPKYDGVLLNITYIYNGSEVYEFIKNLPVTKFIVNTGIVFIGTKNLLITKDKVVMERFKRALQEMPINTFIDNLVAGLRQNVVFHFELLASDKYGSQCVIYDKTFCVLIGTTYFDNAQKHFELFRRADLNCLDVKEFSTRYEVEEYINDQHNKMLNGDLSVEPEGFVIYSNDSAFKYKFPEFYIAHKPGNYVEDAIKLSDMLNGITRYAKLQEPLSAKINELSNWLTPLYNQSSEDRNILIETNRCLINKIDNEMNKIKFSKKKKFKLCNFIRNSNQISPEHFHQFVIEFLRSKSD